MIKREPGESERGCWLREDRRLKKLNRDWVVVVVVVVAVLLPAQRLCGGKMADEQRLSV